MTVVQIFRQNGKMKKLTDIYNQMVSDGSLKDDLGQRIILKELEKVRSERENKQVPDGISDTEQKHDMGDQGTTSPIGSK